MQRLADQLWALHLAATGLLLLTWIVFAKASPETRALFFEVGPRTLDVALFSTALLSWAWAGAAIAVMKWVRVAADDVVFIVLGFALSLLAIIIVREHVSFGDYMTFVHAARLVAEGQPQHIGYLYPPLFALILSLFHLTGGMFASAVALFALNHLSLVAFYVLGVGFLRACGLSRSFASLLLFASLALNMAVMRNTVYVQVNLLLMDFILVSVLYFAKSRILSATSLALGAHLKLLPLAFVPVFLLTACKRWMLAFALALAGITALTLTLGDPSQWQSFFDNLGRWTPEELRSATVYSLLQNTNRIFGLAIPAHTIALVLRVLLVAGVYATAHRAVKRQTFAQPDDPRMSLLLNASVPLLFLMPVTSPGVWVYHLVVLIIPTILVGLRVQTPTVVLLYWVAVFTTFWMPTVDLYPWSSLRLFGWLTLLGLTVWTVERDTRPAWPARFAAELDRFVRAVAS